MQVISLFSGVGGFELAAEWMGWRNIASCEINPFGQRVLKYYWPNSYHHDDIKTIDYEKIKSKINPNDTTILVGGFPCQPYSQAGKRMGKEDDRHLWPYCVETFKQLRPDYCVFENVLGLVNWSGGLVFHEVQADLEAEGYEVQSYVLPACAKNAPHRRDRVWFVAYRNSDGQHRCNSEHEKQSNKRGEHALNDTCKVPERLSANSNNKRLSTNKQRGNVDGGKVCRSTAELSKTNNHASDTHSPRQSGQRESNQPCNTTENESGEKHRVINDSELGNASNNASEGLEGGKRSNFSAKHSGRGSKGWDENWYEALTRIWGVSHGVPRRLDTTAISKSNWRKESLKAFGNAIAPPVAYEIFKAIEKINKTL